MGRLIRIILAIQHHQQCMPKKVTVRGGAKLVIMCRVAVAPHVHQQKIQHLRLAVQKVVRVHVQSQMVQEPQLDRVRTQIPVLGIIQRVPRVQMVCPNARVVRCMEHAPVRVPVLVVHVMWQHVILIFIKQVIQHAVRLVQGIILRMVLHHVVHVPINRQIQPILGPVVGQITVHGNVMWDTINLVHHA